MAAQTNDDGDNLYVITNNNSTTPYIYSLDYLNKITFGMTDLNLWLENGTHLYSYDVIRFISFSDSFRMPTTIVMKKDDGDLHIMYDREAQVVTIDCAKDASVVRIYDMMGHQLSSFQTLDNHVQFSMDKFGNGIYVIAVSGKDYSSSIKILK